MGFVVELYFRTSHVKLWVLFHPRVIQPRVIGYEVKQQSHSAFVQPAAKPLESHFPTEVGVHFVAGDREAGTADIVLPKIC